MLLMHANWHIVVSAHIGVCQYISPIVQDENDLTTEVHYNEKLPFGRSQSSLVVIMRHTVGVV